MLFCVFSCFPCYQFVVFQCCTDMLPFPDQWSLTSVFSLSDIKLMKNIISIKYALATVFHFFQESDFIQLLPLSGGLSNNFCTELFFQRHMITKRGTKLDSWEIVLKKCGDEYDYNWTFVKTWICLLSISYLVCIQNLAEDLHLNWVNFDLYVNSSFKYQMTKVPF